MAILDFVKEDAQNYRENFLEPICILEIFRNNLSRGVWLYYQIISEISFGNDTRPDMVSEVILAPNSWAGDKKYIGLAGLNLESSIPNLNN